VWVPGIRMLSMQRPAARSALEQARRNLIHKLDAVRSMLYRRAEPEGPRPAVPRRGRGGNAPDLGHGYMRNHPVERHVRGAGGGIEEGQRMVIARAMLAGAVTGL